ncbi:clpC, partial [Symbiodinium necroappetens]
YEKHHQLSYTSEALEASVKLSCQFIADRYLPDKAIDVMDEAGSKVRQQLFQAVEETQNAAEQWAAGRELEEVTAQKARAAREERFEEAAELKRKEKELAERLARLQASAESADPQGLVKELQSLGAKIREAVTAERFVEAQELKAREMQVAELLQQSGVPSEATLVRQVTAEDVAQVVSSWTGIAVEQVSASESSRLLHLEKELHETIIGQDEAVRSVSRALRRARAGLRNPQRPMAGFCFCGPTGVGKTALCKTLASTFFGSEETMIRLDMSEFMEKHTVGEPRDSSTRSRALVPPFSAGGLSNALSLRMAPCCSIPDAMDAADGKIGGGASPEEAEFREFTATLWSRGLARSCCDLFPSTFRSNDRGLEVAVFDWSSLDLAHHASLIVYVPSMDLIQFLPRLAASSPETRITLVTGQEDVGVPCELFGVPRRRPEFFAVHPDAPSHQARSWALSWGNLSRFLGDPRLLRWFAQNYDASDCLAGETLRKLAPLPLGLDFHTASEKALHMSVRQQQRQLELSREEALPFAERSSHVLLPVDCAAVSWWQPPLRTGRCVDRRCACEALKGNWTQVPWRSYLRALGRHAFVAAPLGHGLDSHRVWEVLLMGSVPVVIASSLDGLYAEFPVVIVQSWWDVPLNAFSWKKQISQKWGAQPFSPRVLQRLTSGYWAGLIRGWHEAMQDFKGGAMSSPCKLGQTSCDIFPQRTAVRSAARVGYSDGGALTEAVRRRPYSLVLFDEVEKAHPDVFNILLQLLDDGRLTDSRGRVVSFANTLVVMTSNIGSRSVQKSAAGGLGLGFGVGEDVEEDKYSKVKELVHEEMKSFFRPEFLNRLDEVIVFRPLKEDDVRAIAEVEFKKVMARLADKDLEVTLSPSFKEQVLKEGYDPAYGARPLRRAITRMLEDTLAEHLLQNAAESRKEKRAVRLSASETGEVQVDVLSRLSDSSDTSDAQSWKKPRRAAECLVFIVQLKARAFAGLLLSPDQAVLSFIRSISAPPSRRKALESRTGSQSLCALYL